MIFSQARTGTLIGVDRHAGAHADGPDADIGAVDRPSLLVRIVGAAAGEGGITDHGDRIGASRALSQPLGLARGPRPAPRGWAIGRPLSGQSARRPRTQVSAPCKSTSGDDAIHRTSVRANGISVWKWLSSKFSRRCQLPPSMVAWRESQQFAKARRRLSIRGRRTLSPLRAGWARRLSIALLAETRRK
ncbi:hypothetical protein ABIB09_008992 [Bradyrhizobium sp. RT3a]